MPEPYEEDEEDRMKRKDFIETKRAGEEIRPWDLQESLDREAQRRKELAQKLRLGDSAEQT